MQKSRSTSRPYLRAVQHFWDTSLAVGILVVAAGLFTIFLGIYGAFWGQRHPMLLILVLTGALATFSGWRQIKVHRRNHRAAEQRKVEADHAAYEQGYPDRSK